MGNELGLKWTKLGVFYPPNLIDEVEMISKEIRTRIEKIEKSSKASEDEALKQEFIVQYQSENQRIEKKIEEIDNERQIKLYQAVLSNRQRILSNALRQPKIMSVMLQGYRHNKTPEAQEKRREMNNRIKERIHGG